MAELTIGEVGKALQLNLTYVDQTVNPPVQKPLDLTSASTIVLLYCITEIKNGPKATISRNMTVLNPATAGIVQYVFIAGDLVKPVEMSKYGHFRYSVQVTLLDGTILYPTNDMLLGIKDDSVL